MIPRRTALPAPKSALRDRVAIATQAGRRVEGWVVGSSCPGGAYVFDVLEDCEAAPGESRPVHQRILAEHLCVLVPGEFGKK